MVSFTKINIYITSTSLNQIVKTVSMLGNKKVAKCKTTITAMQICRKGIQMLFFTKLLTLDLYKSQA